MGSKGETSRKIQFKFSGNAFIELLGRSPLKTSNHSQGQMLHKGEWGADGSVISWSYVLDAKQIVYVNEEEKLITWEQIGGDLTKEFKSFIFKAKAEKQGDDRLVTWILEYEKLNADVPAPDSYLAFFKNLTKGIEVKPS